MTHHHQRPVHTNTRFKLKTWVAAWALATMASAAPAALVLQSGNVEVLDTVAVRSAASGGGGTAVPEPHSAALALRGLGVVAVQCRRRDATRVGASSTPPTASA